MLAGSRDISPETHYAKQDHLTLLLSLLKNTKIEGRRRKGKHQTMESRVDSRRPKLRVGGNLVLISRKEAVGEERLANLSTLKERANL
jgi:hypothetical protein